MNPLKPLLKPYKKLLLKQKKVTKYGIHISPNYKFDGICDCMGSDGSIKDWYHNYNIVYKVAKRYESEFNIRLNVYHCPSSKGWHLTKSI